MLLLGSNQGRRVYRLREAVRRLRGETTVRSVSRMYATEPFGRAYQPWFLNLAIRLTTGLSPWDLLRLVKRLERDAGRRSGGRWGPRPLDVDIILMGDAVVSVDGLTIPHAAMARRRFCLVPVAEVAADLVVPPGGRTVAQVLSACEDQLEVIAI